MFTLFMALVEVRFTLHTEADGEILEIFYTIFSGKPPGLRLGTNAECETVVPVVADGEPDAEPDPFESIGEWMEKRRLWRLPPSGCSASISPGFSSAWQREARTAG